MVLKMEPRNPYTGIPNKTDMSKRSTRDQLFITMYKYVSVLGWSDERNPFLETFKIEPRSIHILR